MTASSSSSAQFGAAFEAPGSRLWLSALADGEREALPHAAAQWREEAGARECWHLYHLIGDVLRSDDLASAPARDAAFLANLRQRLAREPVPLAPAAAPPRHSSATLMRRLGWRAPAAVAAGFVAVAAALITMRPEGFGRAEGGLQLSASPSPVAGGGLRVNAQPPGTRSAAPPGILVSDGTMLRDPRLDAYLRAHQAARGSAPAALPGGGLRSAEVVVTPLSQQATPALRPASDVR
jgi:sigma-E factor negative regulatory protein RseA